MTWPAFHTAVVQTVQLPLGIVVALTQLQSLTFEYDLDAALGKVRKLHSQPK